MDAGANVSLSSLGTNSVPDVRSPARLWPQCTLATTLFKYVSTCRSSTLRATIGDRAFPAAAASVLLTVCHSTWFAQNNQSFYSFEVIVSNIQCESKIPPEIFWHFFPKQLGIFSPNFTRLLYVPICAGLQIFYLITCSFVEGMPY